ncbi:glycosyl hydrolase [Ophiostoma piceae UAMH 11346]|uniref:Glycosyl hydrolase n=1 Tax=Ophiostoma piceae (strain UAMH 11346) TaxID=1262450 RepID=S3D1S8_OPHP1|nr:glycosyl hydrolase [Ophiostoma piceae UAMH 11346]
MASVGGTNTRQHAGGYLPIENYGIIGNMHTCALVGMDGSIDFMCWPDFDSPSVFCRLLDKNKGGYFSVSPPLGAVCTTKQQYLPSSNLLVTRYIHEEGVVGVTDFFPRPKSTAVVARAPRGGGQGPAVKTVKTVQEELKKWLVRRVECVRGKMTLRKDLELFPAFDYARAPHTTTVEQDVVDASSKSSRAATFWSEDVQLQLDVVVDNVVCENSASQQGPVVKLTKVMKEGMLGEGVVAEIVLNEGDSVSLVLRRDDRDPGNGKHPAPAHHITPIITTAVLDTQQHDTQQFWFNWISKSRFKGKWREVVDRSLMVLKLLTYEPTGAIVAAPTFSIPEDVGGSRNWDYRYSWVRDSSFTIYILLRMGFKEEADAFMNFVSERILKSRQPGGGLPIMFTIHGEADIPELELTHLEGYKGSQPVRIGNAAAFHQQFDIYGELLDAIYLNNKYGKPTTWDQWVAVRELLDYALTIRKDPDMSIWEVRNHKQHFTYSQIMLWVAFDRGLRLAEKRNLPCPNRQKWMQARDEIYEEVMEKGYNPKLKSFIQSYENDTALDSSILIAPLVFFISPCDPRFLDTLDRILLPPEKGGLTSTGLVSRYDTTISDDGVGGSEGAFTMCTFWLVEAMCRASVYEPRYLPQAVTLFENVLGFSNHLHMFSEEISPSGEQLGNTPQAFSHLALISAAFNLDKVIELKMSDDKL